MLLRWRLRLYCILLQALTAESGTSAKQAFPSAIERRHTSTNLPVPLASGQLAGQLVFPCAEGMVFRFCSMSSFFFFGNGFLKWMFYCLRFLRPILLPRLAFLPLMLTSVACAGIVLPNFLLLFMNANRIADDFVSRQKKD